MEGKGAKIFMFSSVLVLTMYVFLWMEYGQTPITQSTDKFLYFRIPNQSFKTANCTNSASNSSSNNCNMMDTWKEVKDIPPPVLPEISTTEFRKEEKKYYHDDQFLRYKHCPTSVRLKIQNSSAIKHKYIEDMPILLWNKHLDPEEYKRMFRYKNIYGFQDMPYNDLASTIYKLKSTNNQYLFDDRLGKDGKEREGCIRCAIVGNGGILNGSGVGEEIDAHDYVFRVNTALTKGFEKDVGKRTSFYCFTMITLSNTLAGSRKFGFTAPPYEEGIRYLFFADNLWTYTFLGAYFAGDELPRSTDKYHRSPMKFPVKLTPEIVKIVHPDFERYLKWSWVNSSHQYSNVHRPTTGAIMLFVALHTCDEVNAYGFGGSWDKYSDHYYEKDYKKKVHYANHDDHVEMKLWHLLKDEGIISLYTRDKKKKK